MPGRRLLPGLLAFPWIALAIAWGTAALWIDGPAPRAAAGALALSFAGLSLCLVLWLRPRRRGFALFGVLFAVLVGWWLSLSPSNDRDWEPSVARLPTARFHGDLVTISNVRNFTYRSETDFTPHWEQRTYALSQVVGLDMFLSYWGSPWIAHTIASWEFSDGRHLAISIETRKEAHETYSALLGFFRRFELYYVVGDERDLIGLRTNHRGEEVYLYRLATPPDVARALLVDYLEEMNRLAREPRWYNALTQNCTTTIRHHAQQVAANNPWDWRILVNGRIDELGYERGTIDTSLPFPELRRRSDITARARAADADPAFSQRIRAGLPARPRRADPRRAPDPSG